MPSTWERIERQKLRGRERRTQRNRPGDRPDPSRPIGTDRLPRIKHIVVLMMENHSFDNYLGTLGRGEGFPLGDDGRPDAENPDSAGTMILAYHANFTVQHDGVPCQSWNASHAQWAPDDIPGRSLLAHPSLVRGPLKVLFPGYVRHAGQLVAGPVGHDTYGFRVPAVIVSPYARPACVLSDIFDHTSVLKLVEEKWNLPALTRRDAEATAPLGALDLTARPAFLTPPELPEPALAWGTW